MTTKCEVCGDGVSKYCCPRCRLRTCCLSCVEKHKQLKECNGVRRAVDFVAKEEMGETHLLHDFSMLERLQESLTKASEDKSKRFSRVDPSANPLPIHLRRLHGACRSRGTRLLFLPQHFERHRSNATRLNFSKNSIEWRLRLTFPHIHHEKSVLVDTVDEHTPLWCVLRPYLEVKADVESNEDEYIVYRAAGATGLTVLIKAEGIRPQGQEYIELDLRASLRQNLRGKIVVEYPELYVILTHHLHTFIPDFEEERASQLPMDAEECADVESKRKTFGLVSDGETSSDESSTPKQSKQDQVSVETARAHHELKAPLPTTLEDEMRAEGLYQQCFDYYMTYYKDKYKVDQKEDVDNKPSLVEYNNSDSD